MLIWLGEADEDRDLVVDSMRSLTEKLSKVDREQARGPYFRPRNIFNTHGLPDKDDAVYKALVALKQRPWFSRLWTLQEAILAQDPVIVCGSRPVPMVCLTTALGYCSQSWACQLAQRRCECFTWRGHGAPSRIPTRNTKNRTHIALTAFKY
jgi:hypothetical protein